MISKRILKKFKQLYFRDYGIKLSDVEALERCTRLFNGLLVVYKPIQKKKALDNL